VLAEGAGEVAPDGLLEQEQLAADLAVDAAAMAAVTALLAWRAA
jgi:hypothetical protein